MLGLKIASISDIADGFNVFKIDELLAEYEQQGASVGHDGGAVPCNIMLSFSWAFFALLGQPTLAEQPCSRLQPLLR